MTFPPRSLVVPRPNPRPQSRGDDHGTFAVGGKVLITPSTGQKQVALTDDNGLPTGGRLNADVMAMVTAWRPRRAAPPRYRVRSEDGIEGWIDAGNLRRPPAPPPPPRPVVMAPKVAPKPPPKAKAAPKAAVKPAAKPGEKPAAKAAAAPARPPVAPPAKKAVVEKAAPPKPVAKAEAKPAAKPVAKRAAKPAAKAATKPSAKAAAKPSPKASGRPARKSTAASARPKRRS